MTFADVCRAFARRYNWTPAQVSEMTPMQAVMYVPDLGQVPSMFGWVGGEDAGRSDPRFPGKRVRSRPYGSRD